MAEEQHAFEGRKVFFLYPHSVIQNDLLQLIATYEFEVYLIRDHIRLRKVLKKYVGSILFVNIDEVLSEGEWEEYIRDLMNDPEVKDIHIGVLTYNEDKELARKFLMDLMVPAGFIQLKLGLKESLKIILKTLHATEARGRRKYVRVRLPDNSGAFFNLKVQGQLYSGKIIDISSGGMACFFTDEPPYSLDDYMDDIQLNLRGRIIMAAGKIAGTRKTDLYTIYIILFDSFKTNESKLRITTYIQQTLQSQMDSMLATV